MAHGVMGPSPCLQPAPAHHLILICSSPLPSHTPTQVGTLLRHGMLAAVDRTTGQTLEEVGRGGGGFQGTGSPG